MSECRCRECPCERVRELESHVRKLRSALRDAEPDPDEGLDLLRAFIRATDAVVRESFKLVPE